MSNRPSIVGAIVERKSTPSRPKDYTLPSSTKTGFPSVQHRSKSEFARSREEGRAPKTKNVPKVAPLSPFSSPPETVPTDDWRAQMSKDNEDRVAAMTEEDREEERRHILERFGSNIGDVLKRARLAGNDTVKRRKHLNRSTSPKIPYPSTSEERRVSQRAISPPPSALVPPTSTRPSSRAERRIRFAELEPDDVYVYESAPASPKRRTLALPPPDPTSEDIVSLGQWKGKLPLPQASSSKVVQNPPQPVRKAIIPAPPPETILNVAKVDSRTERKAEETGQPDEGSSEYIRQRFFPNAPKDDPNLEWTRTTLQETDAPLTSSLRFDLHGAPIPAAISLSLPTHLGLHHHAEGSHAGYTLDDIFLLSRSTVPAQRATMLGVLAQIAKRLAMSSRGAVSGLEELAGKEEGYRKRIVAAGLEALSERGSVGARAIEVVWECIVGWDETIADVTGVELESPTDLAISSLPLDFILPQITTVLSQGAAVLESQLQLLSILFRLAQHSAAFATSITSTPKLLPIVLQTFVLTPVSPDGSSRHPNPFALEFLNLLALSTRSSAQEIEKLADSLLRFITSLPTAAPYPPPLATLLLLHTLRIYRTLATYGFYAHIPGAAVTQLADIEQYVISEDCRDRRLKVAWCEVVEAWTTCAIDPHQTTPEHSIKWSQIIGWSWDAGILELQTHLGTTEKDMDVWAASWKAQAAWAEGSRVNGVRGGDMERESLLESLKPVFEAGKAAEVVTRSLDELEAALRPASPLDTNSLRIASTNASVISSALRLWLSCLPPHLDGAPSTPPFTLPFARLSQLSSGLLNHPLWSSLLSPDTSLSYVHIRELSQFFVFYLRLSRRLPDISDGLWMAQAFSIILRLGPGDEDAAKAIVREISSLVTSQWTGVRGIEAPSIIWEKGGLAILEPFFAHSISPVAEIWIGPLTVTPASIKTSSTQRLPSPSGMKDLGLPLQRDWSMTPLNHLLRSADSAVFKTLPPSWDASEVEVTRAALFLTKLIQDAMLNFSLTSTLPTREEAVFRCMQVFMLEHGQPQADSATEVFRDGVVERLMQDVLGVGPRADFGSRFVSIPSSSPFDTGDLEKVAQRFLGVSVPFFQFYTDFVALYDAVSFSHPLFASLLLPPTSMRYPLDYKKHLWCDFGHVMKTIRTPIEKVVTSDVREYLEPLELDNQILSSYLGLLLKGEVKEFPRFVALHHVAANIWPDIRDMPASDTQDLDPKREERAAMLLKAVVQRGGPELIRDVVRYHQTRKESDFDCPPRCFEDLSPAVSNLRMECVRRWGGQDMLDRIEALLKS